MAWLFLVLMACTGLGPVESATPTHRPIQMATTTARPSPTPRRTSHTPALPPAGYFYHGVYPGGKTDIESDITFQDVRSYEQAAGKQVVWVYFSHNWFEGHAFPMTTATWIRDAGSIPYIRLMLRSNAEEIVPDPVYTLQNILDGQFDADLHGWCAAAREFGTPLLAEYGTEVNGDWFPWNGRWNGGGESQGYGDPTEPDGPERFRDAYRHIIQICRDEGATNITWVFHVNAEDWPQTSWNAFENYYPGDDWIDWVGVSIYAALTPMDDYWNAFGDEMDDAYARLEAMAPDKPVIVAEFGAPKNNPLGDQAAWARQALSDILAFRWPRVIAFSWWNEWWPNDDNPAHDTTMRLQNNPYLAAVFQELVGSNPFVLARPRAATDAWQLTNPGGGGAFNVMIGGPTGILLAASDLSGAYRSLNRGQSWQAIGATQGLTVTHVSGLGVDPIDPAILYIGTEEGIFRSSDYGSTFTPVLTHGYITDIVFGVSNPQVGYATYHSEYDVADGVVYKTTDRGQTWARISGASLPDNLHILKLMVAPHDANVLYALTGEGRFACGPAALFQSKDGGRSWRRLAPALGQIADATLDPNNPYVLYVTTYGDVWDPGYECIHDDPNGGYVYRGVFRQGAWRWEKISSDDDLGQRNLLLWPDADDAHALRVIDMDWPELWETTDNGATWEFIGSKEDWDPGWTNAENAYSLSFNGDAKTLGRDLSDPDALLWVDSQFLWATRDDGRSFAPLHTREVTPGHWQSRGADNIVPFDIALAADGRHVYLGLADMGCFRSDDAGATWQNCNDPAYVGSWDGYGGNSMTVVADPTRANVVWITMAQEVDTPHTLLRSEDYGATWTPVGRGLPEDGIPAGLSVDPNSPTQSRTLFITMDGDVYRSQDDGETWQKVLDCNGCRATAVDVRDGHRVYAGGEGGFWRSTRGGAPGTWEQTGLPEMRGNMGGEFWDVYWEGVSAIRPDPVHPGWVYVSVFGEDRGLYRSRDAGMTWEKLWTEDFLRDVAVLPTNPDVLFMASSSALYSGGYDPASHGVLVSTDGGRTWQPFNQGLAWPFASLLAIDTSTSTLWLGSPGLGYARRALTFPASTTSRVHLPLVWLR